MLGSRGVMANEYKGDNLFEDDEVDVEAAAEREVLEDDRALAQMPGFKGWAHRRADTVVGFGLLLLCLVLGPLVVVALILFAAVQRAWRTVFK